MSLAVITLSREGAMVADRIRREIPEAEVFIHQAVEDGIPGARFASIVELTATLFPHYRGLVYIAPCGVVVRAIAAHVKHKLSDPAVVTLDALGRWAVSLLSGHEGGANDLTIRIANIVDAEPVISTTTEALKDVIVGIGCRRGAEKTTILEAVREALTQGTVEIGRVRLLSSCDLKRDETGLIEAAAELGIPIRFISADEIRACAKEFTESSFVAEKVDLPAVAEPCALLAGRRTQLIIRKQIRNGVTVAAARESFTSSE